MNFVEENILLALAENPYTNQRALAAECQCSLGIVNRSLKLLQSGGYLGCKYELTEKTHAEFRLKKPRNAIILAAGFGMRMVPINTEIPKAFLKVKGECLIERTIRQLHEAGIFEIHIVVGFMKESFEHLIDQFGVNLIVNPDYITKNNLHSLHLAAKYLSNTYIIPSDVWCQENPYRKQELCSWYMVSDEKTDASPVRVNRSMELTTTPVEGNAMVGISYVLREEAAQIRQQMERMDQDARYGNCYWEDAAYQKGKMLMRARVVPHKTVAAIDTYEQLRELDDSSEQLRSEAIRIAAKAVGSSPEKISHITVMKKGMTNRSFLFHCDGIQYIMRIPGEGTDKLINRREEASVYRIIQDRNICDHVLYMNPDNGYKITEFLTGARCCHAENPEDVRICMARLREFHEMKLRVDHEFDLFGKIQFYESLWEGVTSAYQDYAQTKAQVFSLKPYIESHVSEKVLAHIDAVPDNFLITEGETGTDIRLIDWEYAAMQDPHIDLAMFCIYALYDRPHVDALIDSYFTEGCSRENRIKIYCYIAACGLLWSNWCEYKQILGVEFGAYSLRQYRYAKEYYKIAVDEMAGGSYGV